MLQISTSLLTATIMLVHALLGCCWHHDHAHAGKCEVAVAGHQHGQDQHRHSHSHAHDQDDHDESGNDECPGECDEGQCTFIRSQTVDVSTSLLVTDSCVVADMLVVWVSDWEVETTQALRQYLHLQSDSAPAAYVRHQVWLI